MVAALIAAFASMSSPAGHPLLFEDVTTSAGLDASHNAAYFITGQAWGDIDADGYPDLYTTTASGGNTLWRNQGDGSFLAFDAGGDELLTAQVSGGAAFAEVDGDGLLDLVVLGRGQPTLLRGAPGNQLVDASAGSGLDRAGEGESAAWADFDGDGDLDLYVVHWYYQGQEELPERRDALYRNDGGGVFTDVTDWLDNDRTRGPGFAAVWFDYDNDRDADLYVVNDKDFGNVLWRNDGPGCGGWCFTDVSIATGAHRPADAMGITVGDYDNDGDLDLAYSDEYELILLSNQTAQGGSGFTEVTAAAGLTLDDSVGWGLVFEDFDNDGWLDLYVNVGVSSAPENRLYMNNGDGTFTPLPGAGGADDPGYSMGLAAADYDRDGDVDLVVGNLNDGYRLYANRLDPPDDSGWLSLELAGPAGDFSSAIGARVRLVTDDGREQIREAHIGSGLGGNHDFRLHFGLGGAQAQRIDILWPDGGRQTLELPGSGAVRIEHEPIYDEVFQDDFAD